MTRYWRLNDQTLKLNDRKVMIKLPDVKDKNFQKLK